MNVATIQTLAGDAVGVGERGYFAAVPFADAAALRARDVHGAVGGDRHRVRAERVGVQRGHLARGVDAAQAVLVGLDDEQRAVGPQGQTERRAELGVLARAVGLAGAAAGEGAHFAVGDRADAI